MSDKAKILSSWYRDLRESSTASRQAAVETALYNISCHGSKEDRPTVIGKQLVAWIRNEFELIGFTPNTAYLKLNGSGKNASSTYVHAWAMVTLLYKNKKLPFVIQVNAEMRLDKMRLAEIAFNADTFEDEYATGLTS